LSHPPALSPGERRLLLSHPAFPSTCAELARLRLSIEEIPLPAGDEEAARILAPLRQAGVRFVSDSERFLAFPGCFPEEVGKALGVLRDKAAFRRRIEQAGDVLKVRSFALGREELVRLTWEEVLRELGAAPDGLVVKPVRGFQSDLVSICRDAADWEPACAKIANPPRGISPVTDASAFVVETYVRGEELAIDVYFDATGVPVILGIYLHPFRDARDARDIVYRTSRPLMRRYRRRFERALASWNERLGLRNFAVHAEVRVTERGEVFPIEMNPLRFGLLTMDISLYAFGVNSYLHYFERTAPDWELLEAEVETEATALIVAPLPETYREGMEVDLGAFERDLVARGLRIHRFQPLPYEEIPFYAAAYVGGRAETMDAYLDEDFGRHVRLR
jgi:hypothetical protein